MDVNNAQYTIMVVDDDEDNIQLICDILEDENYNVIKVNSGIDALKISKEENVDLILLDVVMPEMDGFEVCRRLQMDSETKNIPVLFLTAQSNTEDIIRGFRVGGRDFLAKPFSGAELLARAGTHIELKRSNEELRRINEQLSKEIAERKELEKKIIAMAIHDPLTTLPNRIYFMNKIAEAINNAKSLNKIVGVLFIDLDGFKIINDNFGHETGDKLLKQVAKRLKECIRETDTVARIGGDEFTIILNEVSSIDQITCIAGRIIEYLAKPYVFNSHQANITASIGISIYPEHASDGKNLLKKADKSMYYAKNEGKNRYLLYNEDMA